MRLASQSSTVLFFVGGRSLDSDDARGHHRLHWLPAATSESTYLAARETLGYSGALDDENLAFW